MYCGAITSRRYGASWSDGTRRCCRKRDQLSLDFVLWLENFSIAHLAENFTDYEILDWPIAKDEIRLPRDFDEARYRELNPDVTIDGRKHLLHRGFAEQRRYK